MVQNASHFSVNGWWPASKEDTSHSISLILLMLVEMGRDTPAGRASEVERLLVEFTLKVRGDDRQISTQSEYLKESAFN